MATFVRRGLFRGRLEEVFAWHERPGAFARLNPPWEPVKVLRSDNSIRDGARVTISVPAGPGPLRHLRLPWTVEHRDYIEHRQFRDVQVHGPFAKWEHTHRFESAGGEETILEDRIEYALPLPLAAGTGVVRRKLGRLFTYRHAILAQDLALFAALPAARPLTVLVSGATGLVGQALEALLTVAGHRVIRLGRAGGADTIRWDPLRGEIELPKSIRLDAVVHLAGENIAGGTWSGARKERIRRSRVEGTRLLVAALKELPERPTRFISASAVGFYGSRGDEVLTEASTPGTGFLAGVTQEWEAEARAAEAAGMTWCSLRFGVILSPLGGALGKMLPAFLAGAGGPLGAGEQYMSWISLDDALGAIYRALIDPRCTGVINVTAPTPVTNAEFTSTLGRVLRRPTFLRVPATALKALLGELAEEALLASTRAVPERLSGLGHTFFHPELEGALRHILGRAPAESS